ncbi:alpha/beta hydrolase [Luteibacter yeojuensis]|uniref:Alpha/beta hydrolase n=1 Tax=Luteibacter yeojuensis TaxID=345309 RepID=A0A7X5TNT1_9GAMM|nr:alpha/beta hydrolase [Luteibacter yeojuensis]NID14088.1 alpha/beta hydrolase [Luteibacter yeojuensis]
MPIEQVPGHEDSGYDLVCFDKRGDERKENGRFFSEEVLRAVQHDGITDVFVLSHGWKGDVPAARDQYGRWIGAMLANADDIAAMAANRPGFKPLFVGVHWPSLPWGAEDIAGPVSFALGDDGGRSIIDDAADALVDTPKAREALATIFEYAAKPGDPPDIPDTVRQAYLQLNRELELGSGDLGDKPDDDRAPFDPDRAYCQAKNDIVSFGAGGGVGKAILSPLVQLSFWTMKKRAREVGESGVATFVRAIMKASPPQTRLHLMGHSFGCIVVAAAAVGRGTDLPRPVSSMVLVQGALSLWSFAPKIALDGGRPGYFSALSGKVAGPIVTTQSSHDSAVGRLYPLAAGIADQVALDLPDFPRYGAVGTFGAQGLSPDATGMAMPTLGQAHDYRPRCVYNLDASTYICEGDGLGGAHNDIAKPEVAHAVWRAAAAG